MAIDIFRPRHLIGRKAELELVCELLRADGDLMVAGVAGSGRRSLIRAAAEVVGAQVLELDCLRATSTWRFLQLLAELLVDRFQSPEALGLLQKGLASPVAAGERRDEWQLFQALLALPQAIAEALDGRLVFVFQNFAHIRSWDRSGLWETYLRQEIEAQSRVSYVVLGTVPEAWATASHLKVMTLDPLSRSAVEDWVVEAMGRSGLRFEREGLELFLDSVQGHLGVATSLARRIWADCKAVEGGWIQADCIQAGLVQQSRLALVEDLSVTYEALLLLLPPIQARVLESLALDPTDSPHSRDYVQKHQFSRGGGLQGALSSLEQKGLIYGARQGYRVAMPLLALWLQYRLA